MVPIDTVTRVSISIDLSEPIPQWVRSIDDWLTADEIRCIALSCEPLLAYLMTLPPRAAAALRAD